ncbi:MAG: methionyl-tRNA formyltransferase [Mariniblastus sp.]
MRLIMFGTGPFAVPTFEALIQSPHEVAALFTRPIADSGKRRKTAENPTRDVAESAGLSVFDPMNVNDPDSVEQLLKFEADLFVVCDYGQILSRECLAVSKLGGINLHGSLLPKYRGAAPINWAIFNGDAVTGITIIHMTSKLDGGPCLIKADTEIGSQETAEQIEPRLAQLGVKPVLEAIDVLGNWDGKSPIGQIQDPALATRAPRLKKSDGQINWSRSATELVNQIRAFQPWPGTFTNWHNEGLKQPLRLIIHRATALPKPSESSGKSPGSVLVSDGNTLIIQTGAGQLSIDTVQPAGKRVMPIGDFLRGRAPAIGDLFQ